MINMSARSTSLRPLASTPIRGAYVKPLEAPEKWPYLASGSILSRSLTKRIGTNDTEEFTALRRALLSHAGNLPISAEHLHRDTFDIADVYGKDIFHSIRWLGTDRLPQLFAIKARFDSLIERFGVNAPSDRLLQSLSRSLPDQLPR